MAARAEVLAALPTFFDDRGEVDHPATVAHLRFMAERLDGVLVAGTTGEFPALERAERVDLARAALEVLGPERVVVHVGAAATREAVTLARAVVAAGARRLAVLTPYYLAVDPDAVTRHLAAVREAAGDVATYGYLYTERTGVTLDPAAFGEIAAAAGLGGVKLSGAANGRVGEYVAALPPGARLWTGADATLATAVRHGATGVISGLSSAFPEPFVALADAVAADDADAERAAQDQVDALHRAVGGSLAGIKQALALRGHGTGALRMPVAAAADPAAIARLVPAATGTR